MDNIFGLSMNVILVILAMIMGFCLLVVAAIAVFRPVVFKMALRNPPRRKAQTVLIVAGLMLATLIISAALTTGDTLDYSIKKIMYDSLKRTDITVAFVGQAGGEGSTSVTNEPIPASLADDLQIQFADDPDFDAFMPVLTTDVPVINPEARLSEPSAILTGLDWRKVEDIGGIQQPGGGTVDLSQIGPGQAIMSETLATNTGTEPGDTVRLFIGNEPHEVEIAAIGQDSILTGINLGGEEGPTSHGLAMSLAEVQQLTGLDGQARFISVTLPGGVENSVSHSEAAEAKLKSALEGTPYGVNPIKADSLDQAELLGSIFVSLFLVLGLFSIAAGVLLIFLIFMMLASERRPEMGMARAVGMRQSQLVQQFLSEGTLYDLGAALVGAAVGVGVAFIMVEIMNQLFSDIGAFSVTPHWSLRSLAVAYALGVTVTFITIIFASTRAARLNIVSAIRELPEPERQRSRRPRWRWWKKLPRFGPQVPGIGIYWISLAWFPIELIPNLLIYPFRFIVWVTRVAAHYLGWESLMTPAGLLLMLFGFARDGQSWSLALYSTGISLVAIGIMLILRRWLPARVVYSVISFIMLVWWLSPEDSLTGEMFSPIMPDDLQGDFEMFFISGIMMVTFATLLVIWNADVFVALVGHLGRLFARWVPAVKTAVAYPLASKTKTGLTLAMFSLIVFSLVTMSTLNANFIELFTTDEADGGWDIEVVTSPANPIDDLTAALEGTDVDTSEFEAAGNVSVLVPENTQIRVVGDDDWDRHFINGVDPAYAEATQMPLKLRAPGYDSDEAVWQAIATNPSVAVVDSFTGGPGGFGEAPDQFHVDVPEVTEDTTTMQPVEVEISDPGTGTTTTVTVIGVIDDEISTVWGVYMNQQGVLDIGGRPDIQRVFVQLSDSSLDHTETVARNIEAALVERGVQAESIQGQLEEDAEISTGFLNLIQGFMGLGLLVGVAALGVISFRAVVERRQQIGMLRAIGFQKNMVAASFLIEAMVVAGLGILSGLTLGLILSRNLITSGDIGSDFEGFIIPWTQIIVLLGLALGAAALMTIVPSRNAASVPVAEALRYE
jgi:putative ABC transport system permease protein